VARRHPRRKEATETTPFVDHILYAPILAWAGYLALREALAATGWRRAGFALLALLTTGNLIFSTGATGWSSWSSSRC
jgi:O-antigen ligase